MYSLYVLLRDEKDLKLISVEHFKTLMNVENERHLTEMINTSEGPVHDVTSEDVNIALSKMSKDADAWHRRNIPYGWRKSDMVTIYNQEGSGTGGMEAIEE